MDTALLVFAKVPRPGSVKTRLTPTLSPTEAARLYTAFLRDTLRHVVQLEADVRLYLAPPLPKDGLDAVPSGVSVHEQEGDELGDRLRQAFRKTFQQGFERVLVTGSDHPTLPSSFFRQAVYAVQNRDSLCIGPTNDGGYYLLGMSTFYPQVFDEMSYSHAQVFADTLTRTERTGADITVLPEWYDVDRPPDLDRLQADLAKRPEAAPNTRRIADQIALDAVV